MLFLKNSFFLNWWKMKTDFFRTAAFCCLFTLTWAVPCSKRACRDVKYSWFHQTEADIHRWSTKYLLWKILSSSQEENNFYWRLPLSRIKLKKDSIAVFYRKFCEIFSDQVFLQQSFGRLFLSQGQKISFIIGCLISVFSACFISLILFVLDFRQRDVADFCWCTQPSKYKILSILKLDYSY